MVGKSNGVGKAGREQQLEEAMRGKSRERQSRGKGKECRETRIETAGE